MDAACRGKGRARGSMGFLSQTHRIVYVRFQSRPRLAFRELVSGDIDCCNYREYLSSAVVRSGLAMSRSRCTSYWSALLAEVASRKFAKR